MPDLPISQLPSLHTSSKEDMFPIVNGDSTKQINVEDFIKNNPSIIPSSSYSTTSSYALNALSASVALTSSYTQNAISASHALNGGVTQLLAGPNITLSPTNGSGQVTVSAILSGSTIFNTSTGSYGSFYDTTTQTNPVANIARSMSFNSTDITNGVSISGSTSPFNTYIKTTNAGIYNIQFSAQVEKTDSGTDVIVIWLRKNGIDLTDSATKLTLSGNGTKVVAAWNWFVPSAANDYYQIIWVSADTGIRLYAEPINDTPGIPSVILTVNRVDQFLSNTGSFSGSFTGEFTGSLQGTSSWANNAISSSYALTASYAMNGDGGSSNSTHYAAKLTQTYTGGTINGGYLVVGESYEIKNYVSGDDFSNVAEVTYGVINTTGCVFKAIGSIPTDYSNNSDLTPLGYPIAEVAPSMNNLADGTIPYWRRLAAGIYHFNFTSSVDHTKVVPMFQPDSLENYNTLAQINPGNDSNYSFLDSRFAAIANAGGGFNDRVLAIDYQSDGKIIVGGNFTDFNGNTVNRICRLNPDGRIDDTFNIGTGFSSGVLTIKVQPDDKILVGGNFDEFNGNPAIRICRLNLNGTRDETFDIGTGFNSNVNSIKLLSDNTIIVGGNFTNFNGNVVGRIAKLNSNGTHNSSFTTNTGTGFNFAVFSLDIDPSDNIYVGGVFTNFNGTTVYRAAKMSGTGVQNSTFSSNISNNLNAQVNAIRYNYNKVLIGGEFTGAFGTGLNFIYQLNPDGTQDTDFMVQATNYGYENGYNGKVFAIEAVADGWLVGGDFTNYSKNTISYINYIQNTGKQLNGYRAFSSGFNNPIHTLKLYPGNKVLAGGDFIDYDGITNSRLANLYYTYDVVLIVDGKSGVDDNYLNKSSIEVTLYN